MNQIHFVKLFAITALALLNSPKADARTSKPGFTFGPMETYRKTDGTVRHMEMDLALPGNILYAEDNCLRTTNGSVSTIIFGNCTSPTNNAEVFDFISGFVQLNKTHIVYLDKLHQCLQILVRKTGQSYPLVGDCDREGLKDGKDALFSYPYSVRWAQHKKNSLVVVDWHNSAIREVDLNTRTTTTLLKKGIYMPQDVTYTTDRKSLIITSMHYISKYNLKDKTLVNLTYTGYGFNDGELQQAGFIYVYEIISLSTRYLVVAQHEKSKLRLIDLQQRKVSSICTGDPASVNGDIFKCQLDHPYSLLRHGYTIYVGEKKAIRKIAVKKL